MVLVIFLALIPIFFWSCAGDFETIGNEQRAGVTGNCNGKDYNTTLYNCVLGEIVGSCNGVNFYPEYQRCENGQIKEGVEISSSSSGSSSSNAPAGTNDTFIDERDGKSYKWVKIGTQIWMAENLNYDVPDNTTDVCYGGNSTNCTIYGRLYNWDTAMNGSENSEANPSGVQGICPEDWHLPSEAEWDKLMITVGGNAITNTTGTSIGGNKLKAKSGWDYDGNGTDDFDFSALPGGSSGQNGFNGIGCNGSWLTTTQVSFPLASSRSLSCNSNNMSKSAASGETFRYSVRCIKN